MSRYTTVESIIWHDEKFRSLPEDARMLFLYLLTSPHSNMLGIFYLPKLYACSDLQWEPERYQRGIDTLCDTLLIEVDKDIVWIKNYLKHNPIKGPKQITGAVNKLMTLPDTKLIGPFMKNLEKHLLEDDVKLFKELYTKPYDIPIGYPIDTLCDTPSIADTDTDPETETDTDTESETDTVSSASSDHLALNRDDDDDQFSKVAKEFGQVFGYPPNQTQVQMITSFLTDGLTTWHILEALKRTAEAGVTNPRYTQAILQRWMSLKAFTPEDVDRLDKLRQPKSRNQDRKFTREDFTFSEPPKPDPQLFPFLAAVTKEDDADAELHR